MKTKKKKNETWRLIYPDKTEVLMNYDPIKEAEEELKLWKKKLGEWHKLIVQGLVNGLSHTHQDGRTDKIDFWRQRSKLFNLFGLCVQNLISEQNYEYDENQLKEIAEKGYKK